MEQKFSGIKFRNFGCTSRGCPNVPEIPFHSAIPDSGPVSPTHDVCIIPVYVENSSDETRRVCFQVG